MTVLSEYIANEIKINEIKQLLLNTDKMIDINNLGITSMQKYINDSLIQHKVSLYEIYNELLEKQIGLKRYVNL